MPSRFYFSCFDQNFDTRMLHNVNTRMLSIFQLTIVWNQSISGSQKALSWCNWPFHYFVIEIWLCVVHTTVSVEHVLLPRTWNLTWMQYVCFLKHRMIETRLANRHHYCNVCQQVPPFKITIHKLAFAIFLAFFRKLCRFFLILFNEKKIWFSCIFNFFI